MQNSLCRLKSFSSTVKQWLFIYHFFKMRVLKYKGEDILANAKD